MSDLTDRKPRPVRTMLLRVRASGTWEPTAKVLHVEEDTIAKVAPSRRPVTTRLAGLVRVDDLLAERHLSPRVCPHCGHPPDDFVDEETTVTAVTAASPTEAP